MLSLLEEAISCEEEAAKEQEKLACSLYNNQYYEEAQLCMSCAYERKQRAEWLKALKEIWDSGDCNDCRNGQCEWKPKLGQLVRFNCPHYVGVANGEVNADEESE